MKVNILTCLLRFCQALVFEQQLLDSGQGEIWQDAWCQNCGQMVDASGAHTGVVDRHTHVRVAVEAIRVELGDLIEAQVLWGNTQAG
jgi:2-methylaconitate cis-trans-isomerase PrpF